MLLAAIRSAFCPPVGRPGSRPSPLSHDGCAPRLPAGVDNHAQTPSSGQAFCQLGFERLGSSGWLSHSRAHLDEQNRSPRLIAVSGRTLPHGQRPSRRLGGSALIGAGGVTTARGCPPRLDHHLTGVAEPSERLSLGLWASASGARQLRTSARHDQAVSGRLEGISAGAEWPSTERAETRMTLRFRPG